MLRKNENDHICKEWCQKNGSREDSRKEIHLPTKPQIVTLYSSVTFEKKTWIYAKGQKMNSAYFKEKKW